MRLTTVAKGVVHNIIQGRSILQDSRRSAHKVGRTLQGSNKRWAAAPHSTATKIGRSFTQNCNKRKVAAPHSTVTRIGRNFTQDCNKIRPQLHTRIGRSSTLDSYRNMQGLRLQGISTLQLIEYVWYVGVGEGLLNSHRLGQG